MADTVAGAREVDAVLLGNRADEAVVVGVLKARLEGVVVDVSHTALSLYSGYTDSLKFEVSHSARSVLRKGLVDLYADFFALDVFAVYKVLS